MGITRRNVSSGVRSFPSWARWAMRIVVRVAAGVFVLITAAFFLIQLTPGDPVRRILGSAATSDDIARVRQSLGLDDPLPERYAHYLGHAARLDFGKSFQTGEDVMAILAARGPHTLALASASLLVALGVSIPLGLLIAGLTTNERRPTLNAGFTGIAGLLAAIPPYVLAMILVAVFAVGLRWFAIAGADSWSSLVLPALATGLPFAAILVRIVRVEALTALQSDYARTVRGKRLPARTLYVKHLLPNVLTGLITVGGVFFGYLLAGSVIVESVFAWPGVGTELADAIADRDYPVLQGAVLFIGAVVLLVNALVDVILALLDPRLRTASQ